MFKIIFCLIILNYYILKEVRKIRERTRRTHLTDLREQAAINRSSNKAAIVGPTIRIDHADHHADHLVSNAKAVSAAATARVAIDDRLDHHDVHDLRVAKVATISPVTTPSESAAVVVVATEAATVVNTVVAIEVDKAVLAAARAVSDDAATTPSLTEDANSIVIRLRTRRKLAN